MTTPQPVCPACWIAIFPGCRPPLIRNAGLETCCVCLHPTASGLTARIDPSTVPYPTEEDE